MKMKKKTKKKEVTKILNDDLDEIIDKSKSFEVILFQTLMEDINQIWFECNSIEKI